MEGGERGRQFDDRGRIELLTLVEQGNRARILKGFNVNSVLLPVASIGDESIDILIKSTRLLIAAHVYLGGIFSGTAALIGNGRAPCEMEEEKREDTELDKKKRSHTILWLAILARFPSISSGEIDRGIVGSLNPDKVTGDGVDFKAE